MMQDIDAISPEQLHDDPYPFYALLREHRPVHYYEPTGEWFITRWGDCQVAGAKDGVFGPSDGFMPMVKTMGVPNVLTLAGPAHEALRADIDAPLQPGSVDTYVEASARPIIRSRLAELARLGRADLTKDFFEPVSVRCVADVIGLNDVDDATLVRWFLALNAGAQNVADDEDVWTMLDGVKREIDDAVQIVVDKVSTAPNDSMISHFIAGAASSGCKRLSTELMATLRVIILGGLQEPGHGAANAAFGLLGSPRQAAALADDPAGLAQRAFDEGIRWIAPIGVSARRTTAPVDLAGVTIPAGERVAIVLSSANRDTQRWDNAEDFVLDRPRKTSAAFGYRPHFCSGHYLSRHIGRIALEEAFKTLPELRLDEAGTVQTQGWRFRGVTSLPAVWRID